MSVFLRRYRNDMLLIAALLLLCGLIFAVRTCRSEKGKYAVVEIDGAVADVFLLAENTEKSYREGEELLNRIRIENSEALLRMVSCGLGCAVVSGLAAATNRGLISFPLVGKSTSRELYMIQPRDRRPTKAARSFIDFILASTR